MLVLCEQVHKANSTTRQSRKTCQRLFIPIRISADRADLIEKYVRGRVPGHKATEWPHQYKDFHLPFLKNSGCYHFNAKLFQIFILLLVRC